MTDKKKKKKIPRTISKQMSLSLGKRQTSIKTNVLILYASLLRIRNNINLNGLVTSKHAASAHV